MVFVGKGTVDVFVRRRIDGLFDIIIFFFFGQSKLGSPYENFGQTQLTESQVAASEFSTLNSNQDLECKL